MAQNRGNKTVTEYGNYLFKSPANVLLLPQNIISMTFVRDNNETGKTLQRNKLRLQSKHTQQKINGTLTKSNIQTYYTKIILLDVL